MKVAYFRNILGAGALASVMGITACGQLLDLDAYTKSASSSGGSGGSGGAGSGGEAGQGGSMSECTPAMTAVCYEGPANTEGTGLCKAGETTCNADGTFGPCVGQVLPGIENCAVSDDEDCNGAAAGCTGIANWSKAYGNVANLQFGSYARALSDGSVVVTGEFSDVVDFGCKTVSTTVGTTDIFLLKLDPKGNCVFAQQFGVPQTNDYPYGLAVDANDNILLAGGYTKAGIDFGGGAFAFNGANDIFLAKFDKDGKHIFSKSFGDAGDQLAQSVNVDPQGNIYISGDFTGVIDFGNGKTVSATMNEKKGFLAKLNPMGQAIYADSFGVNYTLTEGIYETRNDVDQSGNVTVIGRFSGTLKSSAGMVTSQPGGYDIFLLRYDTMGKPISTQRFGGDADDFNYYLALGPQGQIYITGRASGANFDLSQFGQPVKAMSGMGDVVLLKIAANGQLELAKLYGDADDQATSGLSVDAVGHVIVGGNFKGSIDFGKGSLGTAMKATMFLAKFDGDLNSLWTQAFYSSAAEYNIRVATDDQANVLLTGNFNGTLTIKANEPLPNAGNSDIFVARLAP